MSRKILMAIMWLTAAFIGTAQAVFPQYSVRQVTDQDLRIEVAFPPEFCNKTEPVYIAFTTLPAVAFSATITNENGSSCTMSPEAAGWAGNDFLQWLRFYPSCIPCADTVLHASMLIHVTEPVYRGLSRKDAICTQGVIRFPTMRKRLKKSSASLVKPLFTNGLKLKVEEDGIYELSYELLRTHGVPVDQIRSRTYRLYERDREIPICITNDYHATLSPGDQILFYGTKLYSSDGRFESYSETNTYWLVWGNDVAEGTIGARVAIVSGARRIDPTVYSSSTDLKADFFTDTLHVETDNMILWLGNVDGLPPEELVVAPGEETRDVDNWYWAQVGLRELTDFTFKIPSPVVRGTARISLGMMGLSSIDSIDNDHSVDIFLNGEPASRKNRITWDGQRYIIFESDTFSTDLLLHGSNQLTLQTKAVSYTDRSALDWIKIIYTKGYESIDGMARFKTTFESFGKVTEYSITGFTSDEIELWDITHYRFFSGALIEQGTGKNRGRYSLVFQDSVGSTAHYFAQVKSRRKIPEVMKYDTVRYDWDTLAPYDYIVISVDSFKTELEPLLEVHRKNGLKATFVDIEDLYNSFTWGIRDPECIRQFLQHLYERNNRSVPRFILFGGDATHNLDKFNKERTIVPVHLSRIPGWGPGADDGYFAQVNDDDLFPDCCIGRLPAQNRLEMKRMVEKTVRYVNEPDYGYWRDNLLLLGGGEPVFTEFNDMAAGEVIGTSMHIERMDADPGSVFYKDGFVAPKRIADHLNTGMYIVNFNGHGGGNIWSDNDFFGFNDLPLLHNGAWRGGRLPLVFSFTCLTGFFESTEYRSLGEEFVRVENDGAILFYGASAYTSQKGNAIMNRLVLEEVVAGKHATIGELIRYCEMNMLVRYRTQFLDLVRQYNLLGDPALPLYEVADTMHIVDSVDDKVTELTVRGTAPLIGNGHVKLSLISNETILDQAILPLDSGAFTHTFPLKEGMKGTLATIRAYAWNDSGAIKTQRPFIKDTLVVDEVRLDPVQPFFNDSVYIFCKIFPSYDSATAQVFCMFTIAKDDYRQQSFSGILMKPFEDGMWRSTGKVHLTYKGNVNDRLILFFRVINAGVSLQSSVKTFTIRGQPDYVINGKTLTIQWIDDSLRMPVEVQNIGNASSPPCLVALCWNRRNASPDTFALATSPDSLAPGERCSFSISLTDTMGDLSYFVQIDPLNAVQEIIEDNNRLDGATKIIYRDMRLPSDTFYIDTTTVLAPVREFGRSHRLFLFEDTIAAVSPLTTTSKWRSRRDGLPVRWNLIARPACASGDSMLWRYALTDEVLSDTVYLKTGIMIFDTLVDAWRCAAGTVHGKNRRLSMVTSCEGWHAVASLSDIRPPEIMASVYGKELAGVDYTAKDRPFTLFLSDPSSVLPLSVRLLLNNKEISSDAQSALPLSGDLTTITIAAYPQMENRIDSLTVQCTDFAGNTTARVFAYFPGADLTIKSFSCHPNPFTARKNQDGSIAKIRFAFLLTDVASKVTLSIFTVSGKKIRTWSEHECIGYQLIEWDGRDYEGYRIANGTYYAKLSVRNDRKKDTKIIRIAKLEGF